MKTFRKAIAIILALVFVLSLVPVVGIAEDVESIPPIKFSNGVCVRWGKTSISDYTSKIRYYYLDNEYKGFFQLDFSGFEHVLRDDESKITFSVHPGYVSGSTTYRVYDFDVYILNDESDTYGDNYIPYSEVANSDGTKTILGMSGSTLSNYITPITASAAASATPFAYRVQSDGLSFDGKSGYETTGNKEVLLDALNESTDDSVVTLQLVGKSAKDGRKYWGYVHNSDYSFVQITDVSKDATPENYLNTIADELSWNNLSDDSQKAVINNVVLPTKYKGVKIEWVSSNPEAFSSSGIVNRSDESNQQVKLTANMTYTDYNEKVYSKAIEYDIVVAKIPTVYTVTNNGSTAYGVGNSSSGTGICTSLSVAEGAGGKIAGEDKYNNIVDSTGSKYVRPFNGGIVNSDGQSDVVEISINIPESSKGAELSFNIFKANNDRTTQEFYIYSDGIYTGSGKLLKKIKSNRWYNLALVSPKCATDETDWNLYVNSEYVYGFPWGATSFGINYMGIRGYSASENDTAIYMDNLKIYSGEYNWQYAKESIAKHDALNSETGVITLMGQTTVGDIEKDMLVDFDAVIRVYSSSNKLKENESDILLDGDVIVVASKSGTTMERTYSYYDVKVIEDSTMEFDASVIESEDGNVNGSVKLYNNTDAAKTYDVYLVVYSEKEAVTVLEPVTLSVAGGSVGTVDTASVAFANGNIAKVLVWEQGTTTPAIKSVQYK